MLFFQIRFYFLLSYSISYMHITHHGAVRIFSLPETQLKTSIFFRIKNIIQAVKPGDLLQPKLKGCKT